MHIYYFYSNAVLYVELMWVNVLSISCVSVPAGWSNKAFFLLSFLIPIMHSKKSNIKLFKPFLPIFGLLMLVLLCHWMVPLMEFRSLLEPFGANVVKILLFFLLLWVFLCLLYFSLWFSKYRLNNNISTMSLLRD